MKASCRVCKALLAHTSKLHPLLQLRIRARSTHTRSASPRPTYLCSTTFRTPVVDWISACCCPDISDHIKPYLHQDILADFVPIAHREQWDSRAKWVDIYRCKYGLIALLLTSNVKVHRQCVQEQGLEVINVGLLDNCKARWPSGLRR